MPNTGRRFFDYCPVPACALQAIPFSLGLSGVILSEPVLASREFGLMNWTEDSNLVFRQDKADETPKCSN